MLKFDASIFGGELPVGLGVVGVAVVLPGGDFLNEDLFVGNAAIDSAAGFLTDIAKSPQITLSMAHPRGSRETCRGPVAGSGPVPRPCGRDAKSNGREATGRATVRW